MYHIMFNYKKKHILFKVFLIHMIKENFLFFILKTLVYVIMYVIIIIIIIIIIIMYAINIRVWLTDTL